METQPTPTRTGTPSLDVFKFAGRSISGFVHSFKIGDSLRPIFLYSRFAEFRKRVRQKGGKLRVVVAKVGREGGITAEPRG